MLSSPPSGLPGPSRYRGFGSAGVDPIDTSQSDLCPAEQRSLATAASNISGMIPADGVVPDIYIAMGQTAENPPTLRGISRAEQTEFGVRSQNLAEKAIANQIFDAEIAPVTLPDGTVVSADDGPRPGTTIEAVSTLKPAFRPDGTVTAGNCCPTDDGAAAVVIMIDQRAAELVSPAGPHRRDRCRALSPEIMGLGPSGHPSSLGNARMTIQGMDWWRSTRHSLSPSDRLCPDLGLDMERLNVHGGSLALGHPFGCTGARIMTTC